MVLSLHSKNIGVIMDVVYNHTTSIDQHSFQFFSPDYYYRKNNKGQFSNASACGNEIASENELVRNYIIESLKYWMNEYHIDGFRFDLMGIMDIETMKLIESELRKINPDVLLYGEGWAAGVSPLKKQKRAVKENSSKLGKIAVFSDEFRDGIKGHYSNGEDKGFVSGNQYYRESVKFGITGGVKHPQVNIDEVVYSDSFWADQAGKMIGYASCHDNYTLFDKLQLSNPNEEIDHLIKLQCLSNGIVLTSQVIPFIHSGSEFLRTKEFDENSFESPDSINSIKWGNKEKYVEVFNFHKSLIQLRKNHPAFRINNKEELIAKLKFDAIQNPLLLSYTIGPFANNDPWKWIKVIINGSDEDQDVTLGKGDWKYLIEDLKIEEEGFSKVSRQITVNSKSLQILYSN
jgi:pullulanase